MPFDVDKLRVERVSVELTYHAAYQFWNLRGVLAERWGHGPIFGGYREGPDVVSLVPPSPSSDERLLGVYGLRTAGLIAEGPEWSESAEDLAQKWLNDVYETLEPRRTTSVRVQVIGLYPVRDALRASNKLRERYYNAETFNKVVPSRFPDFHAAIEGMGLDGDPPMSWVVGVYGPPHAGQGLFTFSDAGRDSEWWMCVRTASIQQNENGLDAPGVGLTNLRQLQKDFDQVVRTTLPSVVD
jgi:hypothetical protein